MVLATSDNCQLKITKALPQHQSQNSDYNNKKKKKKKEKKNRKEKNRKGKERKGRKK